MTSTALTQTVLYTNPASALVSGTTASKNVSGLGSSQVFTGTSPSGAAIGQVLAYGLQAPRPAPLWYISTINATDTYSIFTIENNPISLTPFTAASGFNGGFFQPNPGQKFVLYYTPGVVIAAAGPTFNLQSVVENTLSQYIAMGTIKFEHADKVRVKPVVRQITTGNTVSAIPNTFVFDFDSYPIEETVNALVVFQGLLNAQAVITYGSYGSMAGNTTSQQFQVVGGQYSSITYPGGKGMKFTGSVFLLLNNIGMVSLPATTFIPAPSSMFDEVDFSLGVGSSGSTTVAGVGDGMEVVLAAISNLRANLSDRTQSEGDDNFSLIKSVHSTVKNLDTKVLESTQAAILGMMKGMRSMIEELKNDNEAAHERIEAKTNSLLALAKATGAYGDLQLGD